MILTNKFLKKIQIQNIPLLSYNLVTASTTLPGLEEEEEEEGAAEGEGEQEPEEES